VGVDFYTCENCSYNFPDCGDYFFCEGCSSRFCSTECGGAKYDPEGSDVGSCVLCRKETATSDQLLQFLMEHFNLTYEQVFEMYKAKQ
jgi:hypothetical protein